MQDKTTQARAIVQNALGELAQLTENETLKSLLHGLGNALGPDAGNGATTPPLAAGRATGRARSTTAPSARSTAATAATKTPRTRTATIAAPKSRSKRGSGTTRARRGGRREQLLTIIERQPGVSISEAAREIRVAPSGLYAVARRLESDGLVRKQGTGWLPTNTTRKK